MTVKEHLLTRIELLPQEQLLLLLDYIESLYFRSHGDTLNTEHHLHDAGAMVAQSLKSLPNSKSVLEILAGVKGQQIFDSAESVDNYLEQERSAWT